MASFSQSLVQSKIFPLIALWESALIPVPSTLTWSDDACFVIDNCMRLVHSGQALNKSILEFIVLFFNLLFFTEDDLCKYSGPCIFALGSCAVCWLPPETTRKDRLVYASTLTLIKSHFELEKIRTVYTQEEYVDISQSLAQPVNLRKYMSHDEIIRDDLVCSFELRMQELEREELIKQHSMDKTTEAAKSGGFHSIKPEMTERAIAALNSFKNNPPSLPSIGKWIAIQLHFDNVDTSKIVLDIPVTKSIQLENAFPIDKTIPGVYFLSIVKQDKIQTGQITWYPVSTSPRVKMMYASVIAALRKQMEKNSFNIIVDDGRDVVLKDILESLPMEAPTSEKISFKKPVRPKAVSRSAFISPVDTIMTRVSGASLVSSQKISSDVDSSDTSQIERSHVKLPVNNTYSPKEILREPESPVKSTPSSPSTIRSNSSLKSCDKISTSSFLLQELADSSTTGTSIAVKRSVMTRPKSEDLRQGVFSFADNTYPLEFERFNRPLSEQNFAKARIYPETFTIKEEQDEDMEEVKTLAESFESEATLNSLAYSLAHRQE